MRLRGAGAAAPEGGDDRRGGRLACVPQPQPREPPARHARHVSRRVAQERPLLARPPPAAHAAVCRLAARDALDQPRAPHARARARRVRAPRARDGRLRAALREPARPVHESHVAAPRALDARGGLHLHALQQQQAVHAR